MYAPSPSMLVPWLCENIGKVLSTSFESKNIGHRRGRKRSYRPRVRNCGANERRNGAQTTIIVGEKRIANLSASFLFRLCALVRSGRVFRISGISWLAALTSPSEKTSAWFGSRPDGVPTHFGFQIFARIAQNRGPKCTAIVPDSVLPITSLGEIFRTIIHLRERRTTSPLSRCADVGCSEAERANGRRSHGGLDFRHHRCGSGACKLVRRSRARIQRIFRRFEKQRDRWPSRLNYLLVQTMRDDRHPFQGPPVTLTCALTESQSKQSVHAQ